MSESPINNKSAKFKKGKSKDGCYQRPGRKGWWISYIDAEGKRRQQKTTAQNITQCKEIRAAVIANVERQKLHDITPPSDDTFSKVADRYLIFEVSEAARD